MEIQSKHYIEEKNKSALQRKGILKYITYKKNTRVHYIEKKN